MQPHNIQDITNEWIKAHQKNKAKFHSAQECQQNTRDNTNTYYNTNNRCSILENQNVEEEDNRENITIKQPDTKKSAREDKQHHVNKITRDVLEELIS